MGLIKIEGTTSSEARKTLAGIILIELHRFQTVDSVKVALLSITV